MAVAVVVPVVVVVAVVIAIVILYRSSDDYAIRLYIMLRAIANYCAPCGPGRP
jgi:hypothetical protein